ncbi:hypothetical protein E6H35_07830 [Candidatus Bathyarchaeota archaeon]|nr:MAG: hypothetical protein E6H35_07830 [Candidatus Bathyarchaeota archaeon]
MTEESDPSLTCVFTLLAAVNSSSCRYQMEKATQMQRGLMVRVVLSIITLAAFLAGSLIVVGFYTNYDWFQKIVVILVAMIIAFAALAIMWVTWAGRRGMMGWWRD